MTLVEIGVVAVAGIAGWLIVSRLMTHADSKAVDYSGKAWFEILQVSQDATQPEIEAAYHRRCALLEQQTPNVMTTPERETANSLRRQLDQAYQDGKQPAADPEAR